MPKKKVKTKKKTTLITRGPMPQKVKNKIAKALKGRKKSAAHRKAIGEGVRRTYKSKKGAKRGRNISRMKRAKRGIRRFQEKGKK